MNFATFGIPYTLHPGIAVGELMPFFIFKHLQAPNTGPGYFFMGSWKVLEKSRIFVSKRMGTWMLYYHC